MIVFVVGIVLILAYAGVDGQRCRGGFERIPGGRCYKLVANPASWAEAKVYCWSMGSYLAIISSETENNQVRDYLKGKASVQNQIGVWLNAGDFLEEGVWRWGFRGRRVQRFFWSVNPPQPDNLSNRQHCLALIKHFDYNWDDYNCYNQINFLCESG